MSDLAFPDVEAVLVAWLPAQVDARVGTETPDNLAEVLPFVRVTRAGGRDRDARLDDAVVSIDFYAVDRPAARDGCELVRSTLLTAFRGAVGGAVVARVQTLTAPSWRPYDNTTLRRYGATFRITLHS